jgi:serine/threonine protein kinase
MQNQETARADAVLGESRLSSVVSEPLTGSNGVDPQLAALVERITRQIEEGESVDIDELAAKNPEWAHQLRRLVPALTEIARLERDSIGGGERLFGDFRIVREIGRGGMGVVYEAQQIGMSRRVALKVLPAAAALDRRALERFQLEARVAGLLQHPRIVPVFSVGQAGEIPYYAMRYIEGGSLADLITQVRGLVGPGGDASTSALAIGMLSGRFASPRRDVRGPSAHVGARPNAAPTAAGPDFDRSIHTSAYIRTVARLGVQAAEALGHAHDQGVVHRDIKPANLLLDLHGDLWVADFGMACIEGNAGLTVTGDLPGTLRYMSPEQALGPRALVDRRTDIYALGATLYELLTLQPAVEGSDRREIFRRIAEAEPTPLRKRNPAIPADLATIITTALCKDPSGRYATAWRLADDLTRFLEGQPILARQVGPVARTWRWCRRKPVLAGLAASLVVVLLGGLTGITLNWREAVRQRALVALERDQKEAQRALAVAAAEQARIQGAKADAINHFLTEKLLLQAAPEQNPGALTVTLREALDRAAQGVGSSFQGHPDTQAAVRLSLGKAFHELGEYAKSETHLRAAHQWLGRTGNTRNPDDTRARIELGHILFHLDRLGESESLLTSAERETRTELGPGHELSLLAARYLGELLEALSRGDEAEALYRRTVMDARQALGPKHLSTLNAMNDLGILLTRKKRFAEAEPYFREALRLKRETIGPEHPDTFTTLCNQGFTLDALGRAEEAEVMIEESLNIGRRVEGPEHPRTLKTASTFGQMLLTHGKPERAEELLRVSLVSLRKVLGPEHKLTQQTAQRLDTAVNACARLAESKPKPLATP